MLAQEHHYYEILGVGYAATDDGLRKAYRKLAAK
jgi:DnaJ-class molecular chaperone